MEKNIFEGAKFGDKFLTRDGKVAVFIEHTGETYDVVTEKKPYGYAVNMFGEAYSKPDVNDIVSRYEESIDEDKLNKLATKWGLDFINSQNKMNVIIEGNTILDIDITKAFKAGYRKAKDE